MVLKVGTVPPPAAVVTIVPKQRTFPQCFLCVRLRTPCFLCISLRILRDLNPEEGFKNTCVTEAYSAYSRMRPF